MHRHIDRGVAEQRLHRTLEAEDFLDEHRQILRRVTLQPRPLCRVLDQEPDSTRQRIRRRLRTTDEGVRHHFGVQLLVGQGATPFGDHRVDEVGEQGVVGRDAQALEDRLEVVLRFDFHLGRPDDFVRRLHHPEALHPGVGPRFDPPDVVDVRSDLHRDHLQRERHGERGHEIAAALVDERIDELVRERVDQRLEGLDAIGTVRMVEERSHLLVIRVIASGQGGRRHPALLLVQLKHLLPHRPRAA